MNQALSRGLFAALLMLVCSTWSQAQDETPKPKSNPPQAAPDSTTQAAPATKTKGAQDTKAKASQGSKSKAAQDAKTKAWEQKAKARAKADSAAKARAIDVNHATKAELKRIPGMTDAYVDAIIAKRPYKVKEELVTKQVIPNALYQTLRKQVKVVLK
jgi:competence protein ComEA